jgi:hypothetical protein
MSKKAKILIGLIVILLVALCGVALFKNRPIVATKNNKIIDQNQGQNQASVTIDSADGKPQVFDIKFNKGDSAFVLLRKVVADIVAKDSDAGIFIESIGGVKNGKNARYWMYYINGKLADVSTDKYKVNSGDKIEFKFEKSSY